MPPTFKNLTGNNLMTAQKAFDIANRVLTSARTRLAIQPDVKFAMLLNDAFGIKPNNWLDPTAVMAVTTIRNVLIKIANYFQSGTFIYIWNPPPNARGFATYVETNPRRPEVFITDSFFTGNTNRERAGLLVHEYVHLHHYSAGHPGTQGREELNISFARSPKQISPNNSINNAYCYQSFVEWYAEDYHIR